MLKFKVGETYTEIMSGVDREYPVECIKRTDKFATFKTNSGPLRIKIRDCDLSSETCYTVGSVISAKKTIGRIQ